MEVGRNGSGSVSGTVEGYEGYYNFYNIGATAGTNPVLNGLKYARYGSTGSGPTDTERERYWLLGTINGEPLSAVHSGSGEVI